MVNVCSKVKTARSTKVKLVTQSPSDAPQIQRDLVRTVSARSASKARSNARSAGKEGAFAVTIRSPIVEAGGGGAQGPEYTATVGEAVLVLEDDPMIRRGVVRQIEADGGFLVVAQAGDVVAGRKAIETSGATIGVFDLQLVDGSSIPLIRLAVEKQMAILVLTVWDDDDNVYQALAAGASGYLLKGDATSRVAESLCVLRDGGAPISPTIARRLLDDFRTRGASPGGTTGSAGSAPGAVASSSPTGADASDLTEREREIIELFAKGATYDEVARMLTLSVNTVRHHVRAMYRKLHVCSKAEAVTTAYRLA